MSRDGNKMRRPRGPMGGHGMRGSGEKAKDFKGTMRRLVSYLAKYRLSINLLVNIAIRNALLEEERESREKNIINV